MDGGSKHMEIFICMLLLANCGVSAVLGLYSLQGGEQRAINRMFLAVCITLVIWAFGQAVAVGAQAGGSSTFGFRMEIVGWSLSSASILTFLAELTNNRAILKKWWGALLFYFPPAVALSFYAVLIARGQSPELMVHTSMGWITFISSRNIWFRLFLIQVLLFSGLSMILLLRWLFYAKTPADRKQALLLTVSFSLTALLSFALGPFTHLSQIRIPDLAAIPALFPLLVIAHLIRRYQFLRPKEAAPDLVILTAVNRTRIYFVFFIAAVVFSILSVLVAPLVFPTESYLPISLFLLAIGFYLLIIYLIPTDGTHKEMWVALCLAFVIPVISLWTSHIGHLTLWAFIFVFIISSLLSNRLLLLFSIVVSSLLTQLFIWYHQFVTFMNISLITYAARLILLFLFACVSFYVHSFYVRRLQENTMHTAKQALISEISLSFISANAETLDQKLSSVLESCGRIIRCERSHLILWEEDGKKFRYCSEWVAAGVSSGLESLQRRLRDPDPVLQRYLENNEPIIVQDTMLLPPTAGRIKKQLLDMKIRALIMIPLKKGNQVIGFWGFNAGFPMQKWNLEDYTFLQVVAGIVMDAVLKVDAEQKINFIAYHDQLTGLPNRLLFNSRLNQAITCSSRADTPLAIAFIDLDSFKLINDTMGHSMGDLLLKEVAQSLVSAVGYPNTVSRFGGDEFTVLLKDFSSSAELVTILDRLIDMLSKPYVLKGHRTFVTASIGVSLYPQDGTDAETLIKNADASMYHAKGQGKNRYVFCSQKAKEELSGKTRLSNLLYRAIEKEQLLLHYQPQVDTKSGRIVGCEALIRWELPGHGVIMPADFIPLAEQTGLIHSIGEWVLETACRQNKLWHEMGFDELRIAVNVSLQQLKNPKFVQLVGDILSRTGLPARYLELEITESVTNGSIINIVEMLEYLKALGVSISIDDFGTEYSSLSRLKHLPIDRIKMDMQFVQGIDQDDKDRAISKVIIGFAKNLDLKITAEGVETHSQKEFLSQRLCDESQGFYFFHPMPADQIERILRERLLP